MRLQRRVDGPWERNAYPTDIDKIVIPPGRRELKEAKVSELLESIRKSGLLSPIIIREGPIDCILLAGAHRLEALRRLGWRKVPAIAVEVTDREARLIVITENLHRAGLTALEHDEQLAEYARLVIEQDSEVAAEVRLAQLAPANRSKNLADKAKPRGLRKAAKDLGIDRDAVRRATQVARLSSEAKTVAIDLKLDDNRTALLEAKKAGGGVPEAEVRHLQDRVAAIAVSKTKTVTFEAEPNRVRQAETEMPEADWRQRFKKLMSEATEEDRAWARAHITKSSPLKTKTEAEVEPTMIKVPIEILFPLNNRPIKDEGVHIDRLATLIKQKATFEPIRVLRRSPKMYVVETLQEWHRFKAVKQLGWTEVECDVRNAKPRGTIAPSVRKKIAPSV